MSFLFSACRQLPAGEGNQAESLAFDQARVTLYLETRGRSNASISFRLLSVELEDAGFWRRLPIEKIRLSRDLVQDRQTLLGIGVLPAGSYSRLRLTFAEVEREGEKLLGDGLERQLELYMVTPLVLVSDASKCLFLEWELNPSSRLVTGDGFAGFATFSARPQTLPQVADLVTVLCRDLDTVYQVSPDQNRVVAAMGLPAGVGEMAFDWQRHLLYVVAVKDRLLLKYDAITNRLLDTIALPLSVAPAALILSPDGCYAYFSDTTANRISKVDLQGGFLERDTSKFLRPGRLFFLDGPQRHMLAVLAPREAAVYLLDPVTLKPLFTLSVNGQPAGLARVQDYLYVSDYSSDMVAVYNLANGRLLSRIRVGRKPLDLVASNDRVYVSVSGEAYLSLLMPPQLNPIRRLSTHFKPQALALSRNWQKLYSADYNPFQIEVIDLQAGISLKLIPLAGRPDQIILWEPPL